MFSNVVAMAAMNGCKPVDFIVISELVSRGQPGGYECWPANGTLERDAWLARSTVREALRRQLAAGTTLSRGMSARGTHVWNVKLPKAPDRHHGRMVLRAFQHRLKPLPRALLIKLAALADKDGYINWSTPVAADLAAWLDVDVDTIWRGLRRLLQLGLITQTNRGRAGRWFQVTMGAEAMAWVPGQRTEEAKRLPVQKQSGWQTGSKQVANATGANRKFAPPGTANLTPIDTGTYHGPISTDCSREALASPSAHAREEFDQDLISDSPSPSMPAEEPQDGIEEDAAQAAWPLPDAAEYAETVEEFSASIEQREAGNDNNPSPSTPAPAEPPQGAVEVATAPAPVPSQEGAERAQTAEGFTASRAVGDGRLEWDTPQAPPEAEPIGAAAGAWRPVRDVLGDDEVSRGKTTRQLEELGFDPHDERLAALRRKLALTPSRRTAA
jgi:hypothetical protein